MLRKILLAIALVITGIALVLIYTINQMICRPLLASPTELSDKDYSEFFALTEDGIRIFACYYKGAADAGTVLLCHGHGVNLGRMNDMVKFLRTAGYGVLLLDFRAHGRSGGNICSIGLIEWKDIKAVLNEAKKLGFLQENTPLAAYGRSMGAATLINGSGKLPEIKAFIVESSFERLRNVATRDAWRVLGLPDTFLTDLCFWATGVITGVEFSKNNPEEKTGGIGSRAVFIIHDGKDRRATIESFNSIKGGLPHAETWIVPDAWHVCAHQKSPVEFENRFLNFLYKSGIPGRQ